MAGWRDIDLALIREASKVSPDFTRLEQLIRDGADVNADDDENHENALSTVIIGWERESTETLVPDYEDSLPKVISFFVRHGFDPSRDEGRAGAKCLVNLTWAACENTMIPSLKLLLDAGCRNIPPWEDDHEVPLTTFAGEEAYRCVERELDAANTFAILYAILSAREEGRPYSGLDRQESAYGRKVRGVFLSKPRSGNPFFSINEPTSRHDNCFRGSLYLELDSGWLIVERAVSTFYDEQPPHEAVVDVSDSFASLIGEKVESISFDWHSVSYGVTCYCQMILRFRFGNRVVLTTQTNSGEIRDAETLAYYRLEKLSDGTPRDGLTHFNRAARGQIRE